MTRPQRFSVALGLSAFLLHPVAAPAQTGHEGHERRPEQEHPAHHEPAEDEALPPFIPPITDEDRAAAFPDVEGHTVHDDMVHSFVLFDQLEWRTGEGASGPSWDTKGWIGRDRDRIWFRTEGEAEEGRLEDAEAHLLYGRAVARWWDLVAGVRQDFRPDPDRTWAAFGVQGLAPYWFEVEATAYVSPSGRTHFRFETEYELLLTNRLILQPLLEMEVYGKADPERGLGAGLSSTDLGLRLRYEIRREVAPYVGVTWTHKHFGTADLAETAGERTSAAGLVLGLRVWF